MLLNKVFYEKGIAKKGFLKEVRMRLWFVQIIVNYKEEKLIICIWHIKR